MTANLLSHWMTTHGTEQGWQMTTDINEAVRWAQEKRVCLALWRNAKGHGHVSIVRPDGPANCAQAGRVNGNNMKLDRAFKAALPAVKYWAK